MKFTLFFAVAATSAALSISAVQADDWTAIQLRGQVQQLVGDQWQPLQRGMVIPDNRMVRTLPYAHVTFTRGQETVDLGPGTEIQIQDRGTAARPNTTVQQYFGTVSVEAQVENVQHFAVQTSVLAAVVKGTKFTVTVNRTGASVSVQRGHVEVDDKRNKSHVLITIGQTATVDMVKTEDAIAVSGSGELPAVVDGNGKTMPTAKGSDGSGSGKSSDDNSANVSANESSSTEDGSSNNGSTGNGKGNSGNGQGNGGPNGKHSGKG